MALGFTIIDMRTALGLCTLLVALCIPFFVAAQFDDIELEMRAALYSADGGADLSESEFLALSGALAQQARGSNLSVDDIALSRIEAALSASAITQNGALPEEDFGFLYPALAIVFVIIAGSVGFLFQKMNHGGAMGHTGGVGISGLHKEEKKLPWVR